jgi:hypothetical protein
MGRFGTGLRVACGDSCLWSVLARHYGGITLLGSLRADLLR